MKSISIKALAQMVALAEHRSFTRAAQSLNVAQPWLSARIRDLEGSLGLKLFSRTSRGVLLTEHGALLLQQAKRVIAESDRLTQLASELCRPEAPLLRIGAPHDTYLLPRRKAVLSLFRKYKADARLQIMNEDDAVLRQMLEDDRLDAAFLVGPAPRGLDFLQVEMGCLELLIPEEHPLANAVDIPLEALAGETVLTWRREVAPALWDDSIEPLIRAGVRIASSPECSRAAQLDHAREMRQITVAPGNFNPDRASVPGFATRPFVDIYLPTNIYLAFSRNPLNSRTVDAFRKSCELALKEWELSSVDGPCAAGRVARYAPLGQDIFDIAEAERKTHVH